MICEYDRGATKAKRFSINHVGTALLPYRYLHRDGKAGVYFEIELPAREQ